MALSFALSEASKQITEMNQKQKEEDAQPRYHHKRGNISSTQTIEKMFMTVAKAKEYAAKLENCVGFSIETANGKEPKESKEYLIHFKEGNGINNVYDIGKWHTFLFSDTPPASPKKSKGRDRNTSKSKSKSKSKKKSPSFVNKIHIFFVIVFHCFHSGVTHFTCNHGLVSTQCNV